MARTKKEHYAILTPKNDAAKGKMSYHGERWLVRDVLNAVRFSRDAGPWVLLISRDGKKCIHVHQNNDPDFSVRLLG